MKFFGLLFAGLMFMAGSAQAAVLSLNGVGTPSVVPGNFDPSGFPGLVSPGDAINIFGSGDAGFGLTLSSVATLKFEFLGSEAGFNNTFDLGGQIFSTVSSAVGDSASVLAAGGLIPFIFQTSGNGGLSATNGGPIAAGISIAFADLGDGSFLAMFNDGGGGDFDFDDLVVRVSVSAVPLPAAAWLLISAILGLVSFSRVRRSGAQTA